MLLEYGNGRNLSTWHVLEKNPPMYTRVYAITGGNTTYLSGGGKRKLLVNWLYMFPAHRPYEMITDPKDPICCLHMHLDLRSVNQSRLIAFPLESDPQIARLLNVFTEGVELESSRAYMENLALAFEELCLNRGFFSMMSENTLNLIDALRGVYRTSATVSEVASGLGYSTEYFIRLFKKNIGVSPHQYILSLRMSDAVRMLAEEASIDEIGTRVGYADGRSFANTFKRYYGVSPSAYRAYFAEEK